MKLTLLLITGILGQKEELSSDQESSEQPWWDISKRTPNSEIESQPTTSIPALSLVRNFFNSENSSENTNVKVTTESHDNRNEEEILSPFLVNAFPKFESDIKINLNRSPLLPSPSFNNILDAEEIFTKHERIEDIHNGDASDTKYLVSSLDSDVDNSEFEKRLMTRLKQVLGLSMSGEATNHGSPVHGRDFFLSF